MKLSLLSHRLAAGAVACLAAATVDAMTLGRAQGAALIGRPLEVRIPITLDAAEAAPGCLDSDVYYGDTRLDPGRVSTEFRPAAHAAAAALVVRSAVPVNEPFVTLYVQSGCTGKVTRRYVLLSEHPDPVADSPRPTTPLVAQRPPAVAAAATATARAEPGTDARQVLPPAGAAAEPAATRPGQPRRERAIVPGTTVAPGTAAAPAASSVQAAVPRGPRVPAAAPARPPQRSATAPRPAARLKLEPLDLSIERDPTLRLSTALSSTQEGAPDQRAMAAALWRSLNAGPEEVLRDVQRFETLQNELGLMRQSVQRTEAAVAALSGELEAAREQRYANPLVYGLAALLALSVAAAAWLWRRDRTGRHGRPAAAAWWRPRRAAAGGDDSEFFTSLPPVAAAVYGAPQPMAAGARYGPDSLDPPGFDPARFDLDHAHERREVGPPTHPAEVQRPVVRADDFQNSQSASLRSVRAEELHDVQQEADFFVSLGEYERAIEVLRSHISTNPATSAVAWLDLLEIFHKLGRQDDYEWVRREFHRNFNAQVPSFEAYRDGGAGIETYETAMARIMALWPSQKVLDVIEDSIFREPGHNGAEAFSLEAYRDLLLLFQVGRDVVESGPVPAPEDSGGSSTGAGGFSHTSIHPLSATQGARAPLPPLMPDVSLPPLGLDLDLALDLDLNLDEPPAAAAEEWIGGPAPEAVAVDSHLLDFDLPDMELGDLKPKKTREP